MRVSSLNQEAGMPFPWTRNGNKQVAIAPPNPQSRDPLVAGVGEGEGEAEPRPKVQKLHRSSACDIPWYQHLVQPCKLLPIQFNTPKPGITAGYVLKHAHQVLDSIFARQTPCIYKIGWTHNPEWRWCNTIYGYKHAQDKWTNMVVFFVSDEPYSPAMLEASLIHRHFGTSTLLIEMFFFEYVCNFCSG